MGANQVMPGMQVDLYDLQIAGDESPQAGVATSVDVSFNFTQPYHDVFLAPANWPFMVKVYAEGYGIPFPAPPGEPSGPYEWQWSIPGNCNQPGNPDYTVNVPITLQREGVYKLTAIVELDLGAGFIMGFSETEVQVSVWTAP